MRVKTLKPTTENLGMYNAWVADGKDKNERNERLSLSPKELRDDIKRHVILCFKLKKVK